MNEKNTNKKLRILFLVSAVGSIACLLALIVFQSLSSAINIPTFHLDGAFQTASGLFRLQSGQAPGRDFYPYLGVGPLLLIFPFFKIAGGVLSASVFAAKFVTLTLGWISVSVLWHLIFRPRIAIISLVGGAAAFILTDLVARQFHFANPFSFCFEPGNSLRPIRAAIPYIIAIVSYDLIGRFENGQKRNILAGMIVGVSLLWSNDFAIPTAGLFLVFYVLLFYSKENLNWKKNTIALCFSAVVSWGLLLSLITFGHPVELIKYNLLDVATDQWWYFAPYGSSTRIFDASQISRLISKENLFPLAVLLLASILAIKSKKIEHALVALIGLILFAGGSLASIGGHLGDYFAAFYYWGSIATILATLRGLQLFIYNRTNHGPQEFSLRRIWLVFPVFFALLFGAGNELISYKNSIITAKNDHGRHFIPELGGYLGIEWKDYIDYARQHQGSNVIEDYWGVWSSLNRSFSPWPVDSTIHALGNVRGVAQSTLADADLIITTRYATSQIWQPWLLSQNFWFYEDLLSNWVPDFVSPTTVVWRKTDKSRENENINCQVSNNGHGFALDSKNIGYYKVTLTYASTGSGRYLLMVQNNISYAADADGYVSLPPSGSTATIPTLITKESGNIFKAKIVGGKNINLKIKSCSAEKIAYSNEEILHVQSENDFFVTDGGWVNGIARNHTGFYVPNKIPYTDEYKIGKYVFMPNIDFRKVIETTQDGPYLNVTVEGPVLDPASVGVPSAFQVVDTPNILAHSTLDDFYLTDENWNKGVARNWAGFFVPNTYYYSTIFKTKKYVKFANGDTRKILKISASGKYLNVNVEGAVLNPKKTGSPSKFILLDN